MYLGFKKDLDREDLWNIDSVQSCEFLTKKFEKEWNIVSKQ